MNFAIGSATLARRGVLVQELPAVEVLARVDCLCLDKTGTLTTGGIRVRRCRRRSRATRHSVAQRARELQSSDRTNATAQAIWEHSSARPHCAGAQARAISGPSPSPPPASGARGAAGLRVLDPRVPPRSSSTRPSAANAELCSRAGARHRAGAAPASSPSSAPTRLSSTTSCPHARRGCRPRGPRGGPAPEDAAETLDYFRSQGVHVRVISGDNPTTVGALAAQAGPDRARRHARPPHGRARPARGPDL